MLLSLAYIDSACQLLINVLANLLGHSKHAAKNSFQLWLNYTSHLK